MKAPDGALDTNYWDLLFQDTCENLNMLDEIYYGMEAILCGPNERHPDVRSYTGGHKPPKHKLYPAFYLLRLMVMNRPGYAGITEDIDDDDDEGEVDPDEQSRFTAGDREISR